jgi:hypothetical protein
VKTRGIAASIPANAYGSSTHGSAPAILEKQAPRERFDGHCATLIWSIHVTYILVTYTVERRVKDLAPPAAFHQFINTFRKRLINSNLGYILKLCWCLNERLGCLWFLLSMRVGISKESSFYGQIICAGIHTAGLPDGGSINETFMYMAICKYWHHVPYFHRAE